jgi:hypothetical protein
MGFLSIYRGIITSSAFVGKGDPEEEYGTE